MLRKGISQSKGILETICIFKHFNMRIDLCVYLLMQQAGGCW